ncbi:MAG TPA: DUF1489 family protein [Caulobacteraceae bacterium]|nr:DUF1489 family protein [Caulobacteraceae bacterium]
MALHLIKLCVGCDTVEELLEWWETERGGGQPWIMRTRQTPKRAAELVDGGSLYRVYKGFILSRQPILAVNTVGEGPARRCEVTLHEAVILTAPTPRRPFQGWRYLDPADAPEDLAPAGERAALPQDLARRLREIGAW